MSRKLISTTENRLGHKDPRESTSSGASGETLDQRVKEPRAQALLHRVRDAIKQRGLTGLLAPPPPFPAAWHGTKEHS